MNDSILGADLAVLLILGLGGPLLGVIRWAGRPRLGAGLATLLASGAIVGLAAGAPAKVWLPAAGLAAAYVCLAGACRYRVTLLRSLASPQAGLLFLAAGPAIAGAWACWREQVTTAPLAAISAHTPSFSLPDSVPVAMPAYTDHGKSVPLFTRPSDELPAATLTQAERFLTAGYPQGLIRTGPADAGYNCHGWVFAEGRFWVRNESVDSILADNGYSVIFEPRPGDVVVYRDYDGHVVHTGVVRLANSEEPLVESKWGHAGRFMHPAAEQPYGTTWAFYRSPRQGHLLRLGDSHLTTDGVSE